MPKILNLRSPSLSFSQKHMYLKDRYHGKILFAIAIIAGLLIHGITIFSSLPKTYDAYVHLFFADHYARFWFEPWEYRWYTGFFIYGYPPLVHQMIALLSKIVPIKIAISFYAIIIIQVLIVGTYRFTQLFFDHITAGIASIVIVVLSSVIQTLHVFGQLPTLTGTAFLLNALPFLYYYFRDKKLIDLFMSLIFMSLVICAHHVSVIFGLVFFIAPTIYMIMYDLIPDAGHNKGITATIIPLLKITFQNIKYILLFSSLLILLIFLLILPYWYCCKFDPIDQVPIPHGSRDNFLQNFNSGLIFFVIPLIAVISLLPVLLFLLFTVPRFFAWGISFVICLILGTGGTTPFPKLLLGEKAFNILTLDRFAFWCSIIAVPFIAKFIKELIIGSINKFLLIYHGHAFRNFLIYSNGVIYFIFILFIFHLSNFRPLQPKEIDIQPIVNFLNRDEHMDWRYLTLGFGDQMAWLSLNTLAATVDGNYHSARKLPELISRPVERLENAKYLGDQGLAALSDFLVNAAKYHLRYVFSNDQFYDPLLFYTGWNRVVRLENGIMVWEKNNIPKVPVSAEKKVPAHFPIMWGIIPVMVVIMAILTTIYSLTYSAKSISAFHPNDLLSNFPSSMVYFSSFTLPFMLIILLGTQLLAIQNKQHAQTPEDTILKYYRSLDLQQFEKAYEFVHQSPLYTLDHFLLQKSLNDGGLIPYYAKLDTLELTTLTQSPTRATIAVLVGWNTSIGKRFQTDTLHLGFDGSLWRIFPTTPQSIIPPDQVDLYNYLLFKKNGKRVISTFPTVYDDRIKKPFVQYNQLNLVYNNGYFIAGEILNADIVPVSILLKAVVKFRNGSEKQFYTQEKIHYNLAPKGYTYFRIDIDATSEQYLLDDILYIKIVAHADVSDRGFIHGGPIEIKQTGKYDGVSKYDITFYNDKVDDITIPSVLMAYKNAEGIIVNTKLLIFNSSIRSGSHRTFSFDIQDIEREGNVIKGIPIQYYINDQERFVQPQNISDTALDHDRISFLPHCFMAKEIFLQ